MPNANYPLAPLEELDAKVVKMSGGARRNAGIVLSIGGGWEWRLQVYVTSVAFMAGTDQSQHLLFIGEAVSYAEADTMINEYHNPPSPV